ncbi:glycosyl hydrolase 115 family protein [Enterococcus sp. RIT-PI-f]|uniref:glycosyl hydrolase 115 family protein n=1 Tax=Enterococcus sp. RIT-PI-f TaxID=1690244 RepID=UPI0006B9689A|nr:glycosyl hydrolase 115 family protein [Enterococcus sp. RIT-PI-f]
MYQKIAATSIDNAIIDLREDLGKVFEKEVREVSFEEAEFVISTYDQISHFPFYPDISGLIDREGKVIWESYIIAVCKGKLWIIGGDARGTIFGIYDFIRQIGVSPWHFFADVPIKHKDCFILPIDYYQSDYPSVQYRGFFINDEEALAQWAKIHTNDGTIGLETYRHIFDLMLRLKVNYLWPAMHVNYFNQNPEHARLADARGIIIGTSHCDMLLRSNQNEWQPWLEQKGYTDPKVVYDYSIKGWNQEKLREYWRESVEANKKYDVSYTLGMRGIHDTGFTTESIDQNQKLTEKEKQAAKIALLEQVIADQQQILSEVHTIPVSDLLQIMVPYKEVLTYYDAGLTIPEDVTIIWSNDNYGYMRRFPNEREQQRKGGHGLYYHSSYWSSNNLHYLFISSTPLARMKNELKKSWENGIKKMWVLNVGSIKGIEQDIEFYTRYAWEVGKETTTLDINAFLTDWLNQEFDSDIGCDGGPLFNRFTQVINVRKIEMMDNHTFSQNTFGDEAAARLNQIKDIFDQVNQIAARLSTIEKPAFFQLIQMKVQAAYFKNAEYYFADRSILSYERENWAAADYYTQLSSRYTTYLRWLLFYYNQRMLDGKWNGIMTPESAPPPNMRMYPTTKPALCTSQPQGQVFIWQGSSFAEKLVFETGGIRQKWIDLSNQSTEKLTYSIEAPQWVMLSSVSGELTSNLPEQRILINIDETLLSKNTKGQITIQWSNEKTSIIEVEAVINERLVDEKLSSLTETDGYVAFVPTDFDGQNHSSVGQWQVRSDLGRFGGDALEAVVQEGEEKDYPFTYYQFSLKSPGSHLLEVYRMPTLNSVGRLRFGVQIDNFPMQIIETEITDEHRGNWREAVTNEVDKCYCRLPYLTKGNHTFKLIAVDRYVVLSKVVIYTQEYQKCQLGPPINYVKSRDNRKEALPHLPQSFDAFCQREYHSFYQEIPLPEMLYVDEAFYQQDFIHAKMTKKSQKKCGEVEAIDMGQHSSSGYGGYRPYEDKEGSVLIEIEDAIKQSEYAYHTSSLPGETTGIWSHIGTPTNGNRGLGMVIPGEEGVLWHSPLAAPSLYYRINLHHSDNYRLWFLLKYDSKFSDKVALSINGELLNETCHAVSKGLFHFLTTSIWHWNHLATVHLSEGANLIGIHGRSANVKIDRIFITNQDRLPLADDEWCISYNQ